MGYFNSRYKGVSRTNDFIRNDYRGKKWAVGITTKDPSRGFIW